MLKIRDTGILYANDCPGDWAIHAYYPNVAELKQDELLCIHRRGTALYSDDGRIYQHRSRDGGKTWIDEGPVCDAAGDEKSYAYLCGFISRTADGTLVVVGARFCRPTPTTPFYHPSTGACLPEDTYLMCSKDGGRSWTPPRSIRKPAQTHLEITGSVVELEDGTWLIPFDTGKAYDDPAPVQVMVVELMSRDRGRTWSEAIPIAGGSDRTKSFWHARIIKRGDGRLIAYLWTGDAQRERFLPLHRIVGDRLGRTWSEPRAVSIRGQTNYPVDLGAGRIFLVYTVRESESPGIYAVISTDDGESFDADCRVQLWDAYGKTSLGVTRSDTYPTSHDNIAFGAPHAVRLSNGDVLASFWCSQAGQTVCRYCRLGIFP